MCDTEEMPALSCSQKQDRGIEIYGGILVSKADLDWVGLQ